MTTQTEPEHAPPNPLLSMDFQVPFDRIAAEHVEPAVDTLLAAARATIKEIEEGPEGGGPRTYANTLRALERATEHLWYVMTVVGHLESVATTPELRAAYNAVQPRVSEFVTQLNLSAPLYAATRAFAGTDEAAGLSPTKRRFLTKTLDDFRRHGAELDDDGKARLAELNVELTKLTTEFSQNVLDSTAAFELVIPPEDEARLAGLPESALAAARESASSRDTEGWRFTLQAPSYIPVMTYLDDAGIRETLWRAYNTRATEAERDNRPLLAKIIALRAEKATLLGYGSFADLVLEDRMAKTGDSARAFVDRLRARVEPHFARENGELETYRSERGGDGAMQPWDVGYYAEKLRRQRHDFDKEALRPYFAVERVLNGMFALVGKLYGVTVTPVDGFPGWHEDVRTFAIHDAGGERLGVFYADLYPRETKRGGAWMNAFITGLRGPDGEGGHREHLGLICLNATPPVGDTPALLTHREVETLFHEFGHLMHHMLSKVEVRSLAGTNVAWDFVELPSQIMENWCWEREALDMFARHHETDEPLPEELLGKMLGARTHRAGYRAMRQLGFATLDLALHCGGDDKGDADVMARCRALAAPFSPTPLPDDYAMVAGFTHLFASPVGYAAAYYSYKWAEVLDADAFTRFKREGVLSREVGQAFRRAVLERGDSQDPAELFREFMGRDPDPEALLARDGLTDAA